MSNSKTNYKTSISEAQIKIDDDHIAKAEKILINETGVEELRFSWWKDEGKNPSFIPRPLDLPEEEWVELFYQAVRNKVVTQKFIKGMIKVLAKGLE